MSIDVRETWDFNDPALSEVRFRELLKDKSLSHDEKLEIWAQIARTFSLRVDCPKCHEVLDEYWDDAMIAGPRAKASFELERGRAYRTGGDIPASIPYFQSASHSEAEDLKVDAIHMLAIVVSGEECRQLNLEGLEFARASSNPWAQRWQGTLCNNIGWSCFEDGMFGEAVSWFEKALEQREKYGVVGTIRIAKWCLGRGHRAAGDLDRALEIQTELLNDDPSGYVYEELGEILLAQEKKEDAKPYFQRAVELLENELGPDSERIKRMRELSQGRTLGP